MVEAGEAAGILDDVLDRLATQIEKEANIKRRVKGAMVYPTMVISFAFLVLIAMLLFIVPIFQKIYMQLNGQLPKLTQVDDQRVGPAPAPLVHHLPGDRPHPLPFLRWKKTEGGQKQWDRFRLKIPMKIGDIVLKVTMARFARTLSTLVAAGVDIMKALEITGTTAGNWVVEDALRDMREQVHAACRSPSRSSSIRSSPRWSARW